MYKRKSFCKNFDNDVPTKIQKKMHQTTSLNRELNDHKEKAGQYDVNIENKSDLDVSKKKNNHQNKTFTGNFFDADFDSLNFINEYLINNKSFKENKETHSKPSDVEIDPKEKKKRHKTKFVSMELDDERVDIKHTTNDESEAEENIKENKKKHKNKSSSREVEVEAVAVQHNTNIEFQKEHVKKKKRHKNKSTLMEQYDENVPVHVKNIESVGEELVKEKKKKHKNKLASMELGDESVAIQHTTNVESGGNENIKEKKKKHKNKSPSREVETFVVQHNSNIEFQKEHVKEKKRHKNKSTFMEQYDKNVPVHVINTESVGEELVKEKKKRHKSKFASMELDDESVDIQHTTNVESGRNENIKEKKKQHENNLSFREVEVETFAMQQNVNEEFQKEHVQKKKRHKNKSTFMEQYNKSIDVHVQSVVSVDEELVKEKRHKSKFASMELNNERVAIQHTTNVQSGRDENIKENKKKHENKLPSREVEPFAVQQYANVEFQKVHVKEKKRHKNKSTFMEQYDNSIDVHVTSIASVDKELIKKKKNMQEKKFTFVDLEDENHSAHHVIDLENIQQQPVKETKKRHKTKVHYENCILESNVDNHSPILNHSEKNKEYRKKPTNKDKKESTNAMLDSSEEELYDIGSSIHLITSRLDFGEEPIDFDVPLLHTCESVQQIGEEEREELKSKGIDVKIGTFSNMENTLLKRNYGDFIRHFGVNDPQILLGLGLKHRHKEIINFLKAKHFYVRLGKGLNDRPLFSIYQTARRLFDPRRNRNRLDAAKVSHLKKAHDRLGNRWQEIGNVIHRSANTTRSAFIWHDVPVNHGEWTSEEKKKLIEAIKTVLGVADLFETKVDGISWENVANLVKTRNFSQCRLYWFENLSWKFKGNQWDRKDYKKLVSILSRECYVKDYTEIDWNEVHKHFGDSSPSWQLLRKKWFALKKRIRDKQMTYTQILDFFCVKYKLDIENRDNEVT